MENETIEVISYINNVIKQRVNREKIMSYR